VEKRLPILLLLFISLCSSAWAQEICGNGLDDDGDGFIDCYDTECAQLGECQDFFYGYPVNECQIEPPVGQFQLEEIWRSTVQVSTRSNAFVADMDADGIPDVIVHRNGANQLYILNGQTGAVSVTVNCPAISDLATSIAVADTDNDGFGELYAIDNNGVLRCFEHNGAAKAGFTPINTGNLEASPGIADFNGDGMPEVYVGNRIYHSQTGALIASGGAGSRGKQPGTDAWHSVAADVLPTASCANCAGLELVCGNTAYAVNIAAGTITPQSVVAGLNDGYTSVADMNMDGSLDVVVTTNGTVYVWNPATGVQLGNTFNIPNTSTGGRANIADYDNDGQPEIGVAGSSRYVVIDFNIATNALTQLWIRNTVDPSQQTGGSAFDFEGDGATEVVYRDENMLYVYDGATGATKSSVQCGSGTRTEFPTVADVNADGQADILCTCANADGGTAGYVRLYSSIGSRWIPTREVMNQHAYHITNIHDDLSIPTAQQNNAAHPAINSFLSQSPLFDADWNPIFIPVPDLTLTIDTVIVCNTVNQMDVTVSVCNSGSADVDAQTPITFYAGDPLAGGTAISTQMLTVLPVDTGQCVSQTFALPWAGGDVNLHVFVNDDGSSPPNAPELLHDECDSTNNSDVFLLIAPDFEPIISDLLTDYCLVDNDYSLIGAPTGGTFTGNGITGSSFNPQDAGVGQHAITYTYMYGVCPFDTVYQTTVHPPIVVDAGADVTFCAGESATIGVAAMPGYIYQWSPATGLADATASQTDITLAQAGTFQYTLTADSSGCAGQDVMTVTVHPRPVAAFTATEVCLDGTTEFTDASTVSLGSIDTYEWDMGDMENYAIPDPQHTYYAADTYAVSLIVSTNEGCRDTATADVQVFDNPVADFTVENICLGDAAIFQDASSIATGQIVEWEWSFGDGETVIVQNGDDVSYTYETADDFITELIVHSGPGCTDTATATVTVSPAPVVDFTADAVCLNGPTTFQDLTVVSSGDLVGWEWLIDGNTIADDPAPQYTYATHGTFEVMLTVETDSGCGGSATGNVTVHPLPEPAFTTDAVCEGESTVFTNETVIASGDMAGYQWALGDVNSSTQTNPEHTYSIASIYTVTLTATSDEGCVESVTEDVEVFPLPVVSFSIAPQSGCEPLQVGFTDQSTIAVGYDLALWQWDFGDGNTDREPVQSNTYLNPGTYDVTLTVTSANSCVTIVTQTDAVTVNPLPEALFYASPQPTDMFDPNIVFADSSEVSSGTIVSWHWDFGDGADTLEQHPLHTYGMEGTYPVTLTVETALGCEHSFTDDVLIRPVFTFYVPDSFTPNGDGVNDEFMAYGEGIRSFEMLIYNRWGEQVFSSYSINQGWNGAKRNEGDIVQQGIYSYLITLKSIFSNDVYQCKGKVTLIR
jgi:gliding motility-associated-like protein